MKKIFLLFGLLFWTTLTVFGGASACKYSADDVSGSFKNCSPTGVTQEGSNPELDVTDDGSDFMKLVQIIVKQLQLITFFIAVGIIVWIGLLMVIPGNAEAKEATKSKLISVLIGFLMMISATIIVNALINLLYDIFD